MTINKLISEWLIILKATAFQSSEMSVYLFINSETEKYYSLQTTVCPE